jgi:hypothetical protein
MLILVYTLCVTNYCILPNRDVLNEISEYGIHFSNTEHSKTMELRNTEFFHKLKIFICSFRVKMLARHLFCGGERDIFY